MAEPTMRMRRTATALLATAATAAAYIGGYVVGERETGSSEPPAVLPTAAEPAERAVTAAAETTATMAAAPSGAVGEDAAEAAVIVRPGLPTSATPRDPASAARHLIVQAADWLAAARADGEWRELSDGVVPAGVAGLEFWHWSHVPRCVWLARAAGVHAGTNPNPLWAEALKEWKTLAESANSAPAVAETSAYLAWQGLRSAAVERARTLQETWVACIRYAVNDSGGHRTRAAAGLAHAMVEALHAMEVAFKAGGCHWHTRPRPAPTECPDYAEVAHFLHSWGPEALRPVNAQSPDDPLFYAWPSALDELGRVVYAADWEPRSTVRWLLPDRPDLP